MSPTGTHRRPEPACGGCLRETTNFHEIIRGGSRRQQERRARKGRGRPAVASKSSQATLLGCFARPIRLALRIPNTWFSGSAGSIHDFCGLVQCVSTLPTQQLLTCFTHAIDFASRPGSSDLGACVAYVFPNKETVLCSTRRSGGADEARPNLSVSVDHELRGVCSIGADTDPEAVQVRNTFELFQGKQLFWDYSEFMG